MSMDYRILRIILGGVLLLVVAFALGTRLAEWDREQVQPEPPFTFQATARFNPALPTSTVGLRHSARFPSGTPSSQLSRPLL